MVPGKAEARFFHGDPRRSGKRLKADSRHLHHSCGLFLNGTEGELMVVVPLQSKVPLAEPAAEREEGLNLVGFAAGGTLIAGGLLLLAGRRRAGAVAAASGAALALLNQEDSLRSWWLMLPGYLDEVQRVLDKVQDTVNDIAAKRETLHRIMGRQV
jgi:hypothetical protein